LYVSDHKLPAFHLKRLFFLKKDLQPSNEGIQRNQLEKQLLRIFPYSLLFIGSGKAETLFHLIY
ncbi:MAG TPA: hypothetical protein PKM72_14305, partial [Nitrospirales bacterium]|nr:hypothetical protein [Nitrospirales bacterium]